MRKFLIANRSATLFYTGRGNIWTPDRGNAHPYDTRDEADRKLEWLQQAIWPTCPAQDAQVWDVAE